MRRVGLLLLAAILAALLTGGPAAAIDISGTFVDDDGSGHEANINAIAAAGISKGCGYRLYCPSLSITRAEMATFLVRALGLAPSLSGPFTDIAGNIHEPNINAIAAAGITAGCSPGRYCPNGPVARDQMATFLVRALGLTPSASGPFTDIAGNIHEPNINAIGGAGITTGCAVGRYCPSGLVARDQMATFLLRALHLAPIYPRIPLGPGTALFCTKDDLDCRATVYVPWRSAYRIREGFYLATPASTADQAAINSSATRVELMINGNSVAMTGLPNESLANRTNRWFEATFGMAPGTHTVLARWVWNGRLTQSTTLTVVVG